ncbi:unnamed protein product [Wuchereria bancrofti]|uniref:DUF2428 domain-containing protein n=2 Tax=Wuchereria bancrofti TaxID=6293 RepID=A0A3P7FB97_WUCBA|nr:unnamed protein product [Wuchereria bancrofti]
MELEVSSQKAASNSYIGGDCRLDVLCEKDFREIAEWFILKDKILDRSIYGTVGKRLLKAAHEFDLIDQEKKGILQRCIKQCFRGVFMQRSGIDLKTLKTLLKLQRKLDVTAYQQFMWLCMLPNALKEKWALLASVIPALKLDEINISENILMSVLWRAQARHSSGSVTSDCLLAWFINDSNNRQSCSRFLANCLVSSNRMRRLNSSRFWLAKLNTNIKSNLIMKETAEVILQMISAENRPFEQTNEGYCLTEEEMYGLLYMDYFWNPEREELVWMRYDRLLYGWISVQKFFIRALENNEIDLISSCLTSYHSLLRLNALELLNKLINKKLFDWSRQLGSVKSFVLQNLDTTDANFGAALIHLVHISSAKTRKRLEIALLEELERIWNDRNRSYQTIFILELLKQCGFDRWLADTQLMDSIFNSDITEIKTKVLMCLSVTESDSQIFLTNKFMEMLNGDSIDGLSCLVKIMLRFKDPKEILDLVKESKHKNSNSVKIALTSLLENFTVQSIPNPCFWMDVCIKSNVDLILSSGSEHSGQCSSLPELYRRLYPLTSPTLMINDKQRKAVDKYYHTLKVNCEMLASLCETIGTKNIITGAYDSVWNVLMRSRHKGVIDDCAICFSRITACCMTNGLRDVIYQYFEKTKRLFVDLECTTRNLGFCLTFKIFHEVLGTDNSVIDFLFENVHFGLCTPLIAVRLMKVLKTFLCMTSFDVTYCDIKIFRAVLDFYRTGNSMVRNTTCHCYAALLHKLIDDIDYGTPLFMFALQHDLLWNEYCQQLEQTTVHDPALILLLSLLEKLRFVSASFYTITQLKHLQLLVNKLVSLLVVSPNMRINHLLVSSLLRLVSCRRKLIHRLKSIVERKLPLNIKNSLNYAISELEAMEFLDSPSDSFHSFGSHSTALLPSLIQKTHKMLTDNRFVSFEHFGALLTEIEKHAYSSKELWRLHAAHALIMVSRTSYTMLTDSPCYRYRFISCCRSLLLDEVDCIKRVAFRVVNECSGGNTLSYSWDPLTKVKVRTFCVCVNIMKFFFY